MSAGIEFNANVLNQLGTPAMNSNLFANRPAAGFTGRIFISTDTREIYRDTGTAWELIGSGAVSSVNIYNSDGTLTGNRNLFLDAKTIRFFDTSNVASFFTIQNTVTGSAASANFQARTPAGDLNFGKYSAGTLSYKIIDSGSAYMYSTSGGLRFLADSTGDIRFAAGGATSAQLTLTSLGRLLLGTTTDAGFLADFNGTVRVQNALLQGNGSSFTNGISSTSSTTSAFIEISSSGNNSSLIFSKGGALPTLWQIYTDNLNNFIIFRNGINREQFKIFESSKNIGIDEVSGGATFSDIPSAKFFVNSTTKGFLQPRQTTTQRNAIVTPATGLEIFNTTTNRPNFYDGTEWRELTNIYLNDGTLISDRTLTGGGFLFNVINTRNTATADVANYAQYTLLNQSLSASGSTFGAAFYVGGTLLNRTTFSGNYDFGSATINSGGYSGTTLLFTGSGTVTMNQAGLRAYSGHHIFNQFGGTASGTISHFAGLQILGLYNQNSGTVTPTITNAYGIVINNLNDYSHTFTLTNRWGLYQTGSNDNNYLAGKLLVGTTTVTGRQVHINGDLELTTTLSGTAGSISGQHLNIWLNGNQYKIELRNP